MQDIRSFQSLAHSPSGGVYLYSKKLSECLGIPPELSDAWEHWACFLGPGNLATPANVVNA